MHYVYLLRSRANTLQTYIGLTDDLRERLKNHNEGGSHHTAKYRPWEIVCYVAFSSRQPAAEFERYLKSGSGHAFAKRRLWNVPGQDG
jgi:putative endonuclease